MNEVDSDLCECKYCMGDGEPYCPLVALRRRIAELEKELEDIGNDLREAEDYE